MIQEKIKLRKSPVVLLILDGFGHSETGPYNAVLEADTSYFNLLKQKYAYGTIDASERMVGLPKGQFGNSEVGHLNIGAGRVVEQDLTRIDATIEEDKLKDNHVLKDLFSKTEKKLHLLGLFSDGGVHSHLTHFFEILDLAVKAELNQIIVHPFLDGRDTPPKSSEIYLKKLEDYIEKYPQIKIGVVVGRFYSMDRDNRWERVQKAYDALTGSGGDYQASSSLTALKMAYDREETDEFVSPTLINQSAVIEDQDTVFFVNYRADRARELVQALTFDDFVGFKRNKYPQISYFASMTSYGAQYHHPVLFQPISLKNVFGEYISNLGLSQLRIAETEKYPHVTYFFSGGREECYQGEERILIPSPKVRTYDLQPEMSAYEITEKIIEVVNHKKIDVIICNFANGDMVGHTGDFSATIKAVETLDQCIEKIVKTVLDMQGEVLITADHGNCELMFDEKNQQKHTQHTINPVPFLYIGEKAEVEVGGALKDIAPTLLTMLGLSIPIEMNGRNLIKFKK